MKTQEMRPRRLLCGLFVCLLCLAGLFGCRTGPAEPEDTETGTPEVTATDTQPEATGDSVPGQTEFPGEDPNGLKLFDVFPRYSGKNATVFRTNGGPGLQDDSAMATLEDSVIQTVRNTDRTEFAAYVSGIPYAPVSVREDEAGKYYTYCVDGIYYDLSWTQEDDSVRLIQDRSSTVSAKGLSGGTADGDVQLYQYALNYKWADPEQPGAIDCGMLYILRFADNSLMLIDGGHPSQATQTVVEGLFRFLHEITGTQEGEKIRIRMWFFTHAHSDHLGMTTALLGSRYSNRYAKDLVLETVLCNFPSLRIGADGYAVDTTVAMKKTIRQAYPGVGFLKLHRGQRFTVCSAVFEVLYTWEDSLKQDGTWSLKKFNSTSTVLRMTANGKSVLFLGDLDTEGEAGIVSRYSKKTLKCDVIQAAHHGYNRLNGLYAAARAGIVLVSNSEYHITVNNKTALGIYSQYATDVLYADAVTWELVLSEGEIRKQSHQRTDLVS